MIMLLMAYVQCGASKTKHVNSIILCYHAYNELCREPKMLSLVLTDNSHTCGSFLDILLHSNILLIGDTRYCALSIGY